jgi:hypothetical protein
MATTFAPLPAGRRNDRHRRGVGRGTLAHPGGATLARHEHGAAHLRATSAVATGTWTYSLTGTPLTWRAQHLHDHHHLHRDQVHLMHLRAGSVSPTLRAGSVPLALRASRR